MTSIEEITQWQPRALQRWLQQIEEKDLKSDLILVLPYLPQSVNHLILENLSSQARNRVYNSMNQNKTVSYKAVQKAKERILDTANELIEFGILEEPSESNKLNELADEKDTEYSNVLPQQLETRNSSEIMETILFLGQYAQERGLSALEEALSKIKDPFLSEALQLIIDGSEPELVEEVLRNRVQAISYHRDLLYNLMIEGVLGIQSGNSNWNLELRLKSQIPPEMGDSSTSSE